MRELFIPADGHDFIEADFSQIELRVLAHVSQDPGLLNSFHQGNVDLHRRTAAMVLRVPEHVVTQQQRDKVGKQVNFAIIYGQTPYGLADTLGIEVQAAEDIIVSYFREHPGVWNWLQSTRHFVFHNEFAASIYGRRRRVPAVSSPSLSRSGEAFRQAINAVVQSTAADINKLALIRLRRVLPASCRMVMTIHDSVLIEAPQSQTSEVSHLVRRVMQEAPPNFPVPLRVDVGIGHTWAECDRTKA